MRARAFLHLCEHKTLYIGEDELIVGERGPRPKACPTFPELTCHSVEDLEILNSRLISLEISRARATSKKGDGLPLALMQSGVHLAVCPTVRWGQAKGGAKRQPGLRAGEWR